MMRYEIPIRPDVNALIIVPRDLTEKEVRRIKTLLDTLPIPTAGANEQEPAPSEASPKKGSKEI